ncbi:MAG: tandem-95 repeat protein [Pseudomonas stutzeri]|nr:tandem-95 repeat protein [Stutzerimonas stutzeri]
MADKTRTNTAPSRLVRNRPRPMALEQRFVFDGAAAADAVDAASAPLADTADMADAAHEPTTDFDHAAAVSLPAGITAQPGLFRPGSDDPALSEASASAAEQIRQFLAQASDGQLFALFNGDQSAPNEAWQQTLAQLRTAIADGTMQTDVALLDNAQIKGAMAAYAPEGPGAAPVIYLNSDWLGVLDTQQVSRLLVEEYGHHLDHLLNQGLDTPGDEGQRFAAAVTGLDSSTPGFAGDDDHATLDLDGEAVAVEFATLTFSNAYEVNTATTPAGKESNSHDFVYAPLGQVTVSDAINSRFFSGNDVSATAVTIGNTTYYGWISRPIKSGGIVRGFYFWTDADFTSLAAAQADGNMDGDSNVADNRGFLLVVDQAWFDSLGWKNQTLNIKNVGSSSDRVDAALNTLVGPVPTPTAVADVANGTPGTSGGAAVEAGGIANGNAGSAATGNVLSNDTGGDGKRVTAAGTTSASQSVTVATTSANGAVVTGLYGTLTLGADGSYRYVVNDANAQVQALRTASDTLVDTFTYRMTDASGATSTTTLSVTIQGANDAPVARDDYNTAKESLQTSGAYGTNDPQGSLATGNVLTNDTDVDRGDTKTVADLAGSAVIGAVSTTATSTTLVFVPGTTFSPVGNGDEAWILVNGTYRAMFSATGVQITATGGYDSTARTIPLSSSPATYYDSAAPGNRVAITSLDGQKIGFKNSTSTTTEGTNSMKIGDVATSQSVGTSTVTLTPNRSSGLIAAGMLVSGNGVSEGTSVQSVTYDAQGTPISIVLNKTITSTADATLSFYAAVGSTITGRYGTLQLNADGSYVYTPTANNPALSAGESSVEQFRYTTRDASGATSSATLYITVLGSGTNDPNAVNDVATATEAGGIANGTVGTNPSANLLTNDTTPSGSNSIVSARATGSSASTAVGTNTQLVGLYGTLTLSANGSYTYVVDNSNATVQALRDTSTTLTETFIYTVENGLTAGNGARLQDSATLTITVRGANDAPVAADTIATAIEAGGINNGTPGYNPGGNVLDSVTDVDDARSELRVTAVRVGGTEGSGTAGTLGSPLAGLYGSLTLAADGRWTYTLNNSNAAVQALSPGQTLTERFNYTVTDRSGNGLTDIAVLTITIEGAQDTVAVNSVFVNEASPYAVFTVTGSAGVAVRLELGSAGLPPTDARATLSGAGADIASTLEYFNGSSWQTYVTNSSVVIPTGDKLLVRVAVRQDDVHEGNESFTLTAFVSQDNSSTGIGTINDEGEGDIYQPGNTSGTPDSGAVLDDDRPTLSVSSPSVNEGAYAEFIVSLDKRSTQPVSFSPVLASATAGIGVDTTGTLEWFDGSAWVEVREPVTIAAGELSVRLRIATEDDSFVETSETFALRTGAVSGTVTNLGGAEGIATILDNDLPAPNNRPPVAVNDTLSATEDTTASYTATQLLGNDSDPDNDSIFIASVTRGVGGDVTLNPDGTVTFTPAPNFNGTATFTYTVSDGNLLSAPATVTITVAAVNDPAVIGGTDTGSVTEDLDVTAGNLTTGGTLTVADPDTGEASFQPTVSAPAGTLGTLTIAPNGTWTYSVPNSAVQYLKSGETKVETFTVSTVDGTQQTVTVTIHGVSDIAVIGGDAAGALTEDLNVNGQGNLTTGGSLTITDPDAGEASFQGTVTPSAGALGTLTIAPNGTWSYSVPNSAVQYLKSGETKAETFTVSTVDGTQQTVTVTIHGVSDTAVIGGNAAGAVTEDLNVNGQGNLTTGGTLTVTDPDAGDASFQPTVSALTGTLGTLTIAPNGTWSYSVANSAVQYLKPGETKVETFTVQSVDGTAHTVTVTIHGVSDIAVIGGNAAGAVTEDLNVNGQGNLTTGGSLTITDPDAGEASFQPTVSAPAGTLGALTIAPNGTWTYSVPNSAVQYLKSGETKVETFTVQSVDGTAHTVTVTIHGVSDIAVIGGNAAGAVTEDLNVNGQGNLTTGGSLTITDPDAGEASFQPTVSAPAGTLGALTIAPNGTWTYSVPNSAVQYLKSGETKAETFTVSTVEGTQQTVTVTIHGVNDPAQFAPSGQQGYVQEDTLLTSEGQLSVTDADLGEAVVVAQPGTRGTYGEFSIDAAGRWRYVLDNTAPIVQALGTADIRTETFAVTTADGNTTTVSITVQGLDEAVAPQPQPPRPAPPQPAPQPQPQPQPEPVQPQPQPPQPQPLPPVVVSPPQPAAPVPLPAPALPEPAAPPPAPAPFDTAVAPATTLAAPSAVAAPLIAAVQSRELDITFQARGDFGDLYTQRSGFQIVVIESPQPRLSLYHGISDQYADAGATSSFSVPYDAFAHTDPNERILLSATQANGQPLPGWVRFDPQSGKFELVAPSGYRGELTIKVVARDSQGREASALFRFSVGERRASEAGRAGLSDLLRKAAAQRPVQAMERALASPAVEAVSASADAAGKAHRAG